MTRGTRKEAARKRDQSYQNKLITLAAKERRIKREERERKALRKDMGKWL